MELPLLFVGGEFYEDDRWTTSITSQFIQNAKFLNGGQACLRVISRYLHANNIMRVLLPSYLCPSIVRILESEGLEFEFYTIREDLSIDLDGLSDKAREYQAVYFINYFGFLHPEEVTSFFKSLQQSGKIVIEDNAQTGDFVNPLGDFVFNSMRKFSACDGAYLVSKYDINPCLSHYAERINHRLPLIREYRSQLRPYLFDGCGNHSQLEQLFYQAEDYYDSDQVIFGDPEEKQKIDGFDWPQIKSIRRSNYLYLLDLLKNIPQITPLFPSLQDEIMPMGLPVYCYGYSRDLILDRLSEESISLTVHWEDLLTHPKTKMDPLVGKMAGNMITLPIDQYTSQSQMDYLVHHLKTAIEKIPG